MSDSTSSTYKLRAMLPSSNGVSTLDLYTLARLALEEEGDQANRTDQGARGGDQARDANRESSGDPLDRAGMAHMGAPNVDGLIEGDDPHSSYGSAPLADAVASTTALHPMLSNLNAAGVLATLPVIWNVGASSPPSAIVHAVDTLPLEYTPSWSSHPATSRPSALQQADAEAEASNDPSFAVQGHDRGKSQEHSGTSSSDEEHWGGGSVRDAGGESGWMLNAAPIDGEGLTLSDMRGDQHSLASSKDPVALLGDARPLVTIDDASSRRSQAGEAVPEKASSTSVLHPATASPTLDGHGIGRFNPR